MYDRLYVLVPIEAVPGNSSLKLLLEGCCIIRRANDHLQLFRTRRSCRLWSFEDRIGASTFVVTQLLR
jgi:hypothetical protein